MSNRIQKKLIDLEFVFQFAIEDFRTKYAGSVLGVAWAFLQPLITVVLYWFIFQLGFRSQPVADFPFILWLVSGIVPWLFVSEAISNATGSLIEYSYLVKKVLFNIDILPLVKVVSVTLVQIFLLLFTVILFMIYGYFPDVYYLQLIIFFFYAFLLVCGIAYLSATVYVFFKDTVQIISVVLQVIFWATPIVWDFSIMPSKVQMILKFNPVYYVILGYRNVFVNKVWFWDMGKMGIYYWLIAVGIFIIGRTVFKKCKTHFADVL